MTRLPAGRVLFSDLVDRTSATLASPLHAVFFGERVLRQAVEEVFKVGKSCADLLSLWVHSEEVLRGFCF